MKTMFSVLPTGKPVRSVSLSFVEIAAKHILLLCSVVIALFVGQSNADAVSDWNATAITVVLRIPSPTRSVNTDLTYMHIAIYDAVCAIDRRYKEFDVAPPPNAVSSASQEAAVAAAARRVLMSFYSADSVYIDSVYAIRISALPNDNARTKGIEIGDTVAKLFLAHRSGDGREANVPYTWQPAGLGVYQETPPGSAPYQPVTPWLGGLRTFALSSATQFRAPGPPALNSTTYTADFDEVKKYGSHDSTFTTPEQREIARFNTENPFVQLARNIRLFADAKGLSLSDNARLFAQLYVTIGDALITGFESKYHYNYWRPSTAIRIADLDGNPLTAQDTSWVPLVTTPRHPEYPAAHGCALGAFAYTLEKFFGTSNVPVTLTSTVTGTQHNFTNINEIVTETVNSRVYGGMHFRSSVHDGIEIGRQTAEWVANNKFTPVQTSAPWILQNANGLIGSANPAVLLAAVDENVCWGINNINNQYLRTTDGGTNWTVSTITATTGFIGSCITAIDANTAWVCMNGGIFKTTNGGLTWTQQLTALPSDVIHFFDANNGVCVADPNGGYWAIYTTTNGGTNWTRVPSANIPAPLSGEVGIGGNYEARSAGNTFWFSTWGGSLYRTTDRGMTWTVAHNVIQNQAFGFAFKDSLNGLACTFGSIGNQFISRTSNGGATWTPILPLSSGLSGLTTYYINYAKGTSGSYVITSNNNNGGPTAAFPGSAYSNDNGATWTKNSTLPLGTASFASWNVGWSASLNTSIYKWVGLPTAIPTAGLQLWLKADAGVTLNGSTVSSWIDQSGNGNNALQSTTKRQPLLVNNALNDKPVLHFDGINDRLGLTGSTTMSQISLFLVFKIDSGLVGNSGTDPLPYYPIVLNGYGLSMRNFFSANSPNLIDPFVGEESWVHAEAPNIAAFNQWKVLNVVTNQTMWNTTVRSNGVDAVITPQGTSNTPLSISLGRPDDSDGIGGADNVPVGHLIFKGDIAEVVVYDTVLSDSERLAVEQYLNNKYNITITDVADNQNGSIPEEFILNQNYPNPFNPSTKISWQSPISSWQSLKIYDVLGNLVATLVDEEKPAGSYEVEFNASNLSSGIYFYKLQAGNFTETKKLMLLK